VLLLRGERPIDVPAFDDFVGSGEVIDDSLMFSTLIGDGAI
jgi:hypothetical protein